MRKLALDGTVNMVDVSRAAAMDSATAAYADSLETARKHLAARGVDTIHVDAGSGSDAGEAAAEIGQSILDGFVDEGPAAGQSKQSGRDAKIEDMGPLPNPAKTPLGLVKIGEDAR